MYKKILCVLLILLYIFCIVSPTFAHADNILLSEEMMEGLFWSMSRTVGIKGEVINQLTAADSTSDSSGLSDIVSGWESWFGLSEIEDIWDSIKSDVRLLGTVKFRNNREVPQYKITINNDNVNDVKRLARSVQDYYKYKYNISTEQEWLTIDDLFGGYLSYMEGYVGTRMIRTVSSNPTYDDLFGSYEDTSGYFTIGMDVYEIIGEGQYKQLTHFDPDASTITFLNNPSSGTLFTSTSTKTRTYYFYYYYPITLSSSASISLNIHDGAAISSSRDVYWNTCAVMKLSDFLDWQNQNYASGNGSYTNFYYNSIVYSRNLSNGVENSTGILPAGDYVVVSLLLAYATSNARFTLNDPLTIHDTFDLTVDNNSYYAQSKITGIPRVSSWSIDITDSGTGTTVTVPDAVSTYFPSVFDVTSEEEQVLYFPSATEYVPEVTDVLSTDYAITGEISTSANPGSQWPEGVTINTQPPGSLGLGSIWHYVQETYDYVSTWIGQIITIWAYAVPPIIRSAAYSFVVIGIIFGIYRRLIE